MANMVDDKHVLKSCSPLGKSFLAGSFSATCSTVILQPFDLIKTKMQNVPPGQTNKMLNTAKVIVNSEGMVGLWTGLSPTLVRTVPGVGIYLASLVQLRLLFFGTDSKPRPSENLAIGIIARSIPAFIMIPITVVKTRFESGMYKYSGIVHALQNIYATEGLRGLTCGLLPTIMRDAPFSGIYYMILMELKYYHHPSLSHAANTFASGIVAGILASVIIHPADVLKTKMQLHPAIFTTVRKSVSEIFKAHGIHGFYLGLVPRLTRRTLFATLTWTVFEVLLSKMGLK